MNRLGVCFTVCFSVLIAHGAELAISTSASNNQLAAFQYRIPKNYAQDAHYAVLVLFGGRNTNGKAEASGGNGWGKWCDENNVFINEPHPGGGAPVVSSAGGAMLNDMLGTTLGTADGTNARMTGITAFGETSDNAALFTGKPMVDGLGYAFLFRNYQPRNGKWLTADLLGYPDGWNNLAYCKNMVNSIDIQGLTIYYFVAPSAVGIFGHAAAIYDLGNGDVRIIDFGGCTDPSGDGMRFSSIYEAYNRLQEDRPDDEKFWTCAFTYETTDEDTLSAFNTTKKSISNGYFSLGNNCSQVIADGANAVGGYLARDIIPNNVVYDTVQMYMNPLIDFKYHYSFFEFKE